jgi:carboxymethylenebutenolidase
MGTPPCVGDTIAFGSNRGYLATPDLGAGPAVIVITEPAGAEHAQRVCELFAGEGFTALAPELHEGETAGVLSAAVNLLQPHPDVRGQGVGVVGFSTGAALALWLGTHRTDAVVAVVVYYGLVPETAERPDWSRLTAAVQGHYGEDDPGTPPAAVFGLEAALGEAGVAVEMFLYPGAGAGFFDDTRPDAHVEDAARTAWIRTLEFLRKHLG